MLLLAAPTRQLFVDEKCVEKVVEKMKVCFSNPLCNTPCSALCSIAISFPFLISFSPPEITHPTAE
jgi:hypothetical protein